MIWSWQRQEGWRERTALMILSVSVFLLFGIGRTSADEPAIDPGVPFEVVVVDLKSDQTGIVSATLVNRTNHSVRDIRLLIRHEWLWNNEMSPGPDYLNPGRAVFHTVEGDIPAQGRKEFVYRPDPPLRSNSAGSFKTEVEVAGFSEVGD